MITKRNRDQPASQPLRRQSEAGKASVSRGWRGQTPLICILLTLCTMAVYWPVRHFEFVNYDDLDAIARNPAIRGGLSWHNVAWAFQNRHMGNWQPLTSLSHMVDCKLFGLRAGPHHLTNLVLHLANTLLLFSVLRQLTDAIWRSAFVAALFALHPLHVESVAWVSERKDLLSTLFFLFTIWAYGCCLEAKQGSIRYSCLGGKFKGATLWYLMALGLYACGLMSKPMVVTLPFLLLLLDYWPLRRPELNVERWKRNILWPLVREKVPFLVLSLSVCAITVVTQSHSKAVASLVDWPGPERIANALTACVRYVGKAILPAGLVPLYPRISHLPIWQVAGAALLLAGITFGVIRFARRRPYLPVGWFWFLGALVPVIGIVQVGNQAMADRYTYIPLIGLFIMVTWGMTDIWVEQSFARPVLGLLAAVALLASAWLTHTQVAYWQDSIKLFSHMAVVRPEVPLAHNNIGAALYDQERFAEAMLPLREALRLNPHYVDAHNNLGLCFWRSGQDQEAIVQFEAVLKEGPDPKANYNLGVVYFNEGKLDQAKTCFVAALRLEPDNPAALNNLGNVLAAQGQADDASAQFAAALRVAPDFVEARCNLARYFAEKGATSQALEGYATALGVRPDYAEAHVGAAKILEQTGQLPEAAEHYAVAIQLQPTLAEAQNNLSNLAAKLNNATAALSCGQAAVRLKPEWPQAHYNLANALFLQGELAEAVTQYSEALRLKTNYFEARQNMGFALEKLGWDKEATSNYVEVVRIRPDFAAAYNHLAIVLARQRRFDEAIKAAEEGLRLAEASGQSKLAAEMKPRLENYRAGRP